MTKILITGGSGLLGRAISELLSKKSYQVVWLSREEGNYQDIKKYKWDVDKGFIDEKAFEGVDSIIHLAGAGIADKRWTKKYKKQIVDSRIKSNELLFKYISKNNYPVKTFVGGSAMGYYGAINSEHVFTETDAAGNDFLAQTCVLWEKSYDPFINAGIRTCIIRTGVVLSKNGGAFAKMAPAFKLGLGGAIGSGEQYFPWIHINDIAAIFVHALLNPNANGVYNGVATQQIDNKDFSILLAKSFRKPFFIPNIPVFILKLLMGEGAVMVTTGVKISNQKIKESGYKFEFETVEEALQSLVASR